MESRVCLTTYVYGDIYQDYIPLLVYSIHKAYPDYYIMLFLHGKLRPDIDAQLRECGLYNNLEFREEHFSNCPKMTPIKSMAFRWVLWDDKFDQFDYIYTVDIDMLYIREDTPLHEQHIMHMDFIGLPFSNILRTLKIRSASVFDILRRIKHAGMKKFGLFLRSNGKYEYRATGLHFVSTKPYYEELTPALREKYTALIRSGKMFDHTLTTDNEAFLFWMLKDMGFDMKEMGVQSALNSVSMLDFRDPKQKDFRPHHGIHLGIFRTEDNLKNGANSVLNSDTYRYYIDVLKKDILPDPCFKQLYDMLSPRQKIYFDRLYKYYNIT